MKYLLLSVAPAAMLLAMPAAAATVCPTVGSVTTCTGDNLGEVKFGKTVGGQTVIVTAGATLTNTADDAVRMRGTGNTLINNGTINGAYDQADGGSDGVDGGANLTVINTGTITATNKGVDAEALNGLTVLNSGTISAYDKAIRNQNGNNAVLVNSGLIQSATDEGFESGNDAQINNSGTIVAGDDAVQVAQNGQIVNSGTIRNVISDPANLQDAIDIDSGLIINTGAIIAEGSAGIDFDANVDNDDDPETTPNAAGIVVNAGLIQGAEAAIESDPRAMGVQTIYNSGSLVGTQGTALMLWGGDDALILQAGGSITGDSFFGTGADQLVFEATFAGESFGLFDGGLDADTDTVSFADYLFSDLTSLTLLDDVFSLTFSDAFSLSLTNWDLFTFADARYDHAQFAAAATTPAPVPLPAAGWLMLAGLGGIAALRRRKA
ncbi:VPLPA-CTERM sorting domain-containing protein [Frigidibacter sp. MR17.14]|uniref:VPLPA-CTERM sorting domain-containing protein n=1 Tax=Frigidibacter sp. MR17.14 TaxID=3126509 RepID=UPI0030130FFD